jgi:hypothetical protein
MSDLQTQLPDTDYFFLGDGRIMAALQWSRHPDASPYGLMLYDPARVSRKNGSLLFHPELGLSRTMLSVIIDGVRHRPAHESVRVAWDIGEIPAVTVRWSAGSVEVTERFHVQEGTSNLLRDVRLSAAPEERIELEAALYANPLFFDEFGARAGSVLYASGYASVSFYAVPGGSAFERFLNVPVQAHPERIAATFIYSIDATGTHEFSLYPDDHRFPPLPASPPPSVDPGGSFKAAPGSDADAELPSLAARIAGLYRISKVSLRASVAELGRFDASIWQYDFEWGMDAAMVAIAATDAGMFDLARQVLLNILRRLSNTQGMIAEASRFRGGEMSELNGNGAVLNALRHYWRWSGDETLMRTYWERITAIAEYLLLPEFQHESGLLKTRRDFWERTPWMGVSEGFELGHQVYAAIGLRGAGEMAARLGRADAASRWREASERIHDAMLHHPAFSLVEDGRFIHRRLLDGSSQTHLIPDPDYREEGYTSYIPSNIEGDTTPRACEPDITEALPIIYRLVDPGSGLARQTMESLGPLWSPTGIGGYARYNIASDPDSPGPWAFATAFMGAAEIESGLDQRAHRTIGWLLERAGAGGSWFEYYGERKTPPYPPIGIIVWGWAQYIILVVEHLLGVRVMEDEIRIAPKLVGIEHAVRLGQHRITIVVRGDGGALLDGAPVELAHGGVSLRLPLDADHTVEFIP